MAQTGQLQPLTTAHLDALDAEWGRQRGSPADRQSASAKQARWARSSEATFLRYTPCPLCGSDDYTPFYREVCRGRRDWKRVIADTAIAAIGRPRAAALASAVLRRPVTLVPRQYAVMQCPDCRFLFRNPTYTAQGLARAYNSGGYSGFLSGTYSEQRRQLYAHIYDRMDLAARTLNFGSRRLLDFGCGFGLFLDFMRGRGWEPHGFDFSADSIELARRTFGLEHIRSGTLDETTFDEPFDAVSLISVAAHLTDPMETFRSVRGILRPGGLLLLWTVNAGGYGHRVQRDHWFGFTANHLVFFDSSSITRALTQAGFAKVEFGNDDRHFQDLVRRGLVADADRAAVEARFRDDILGDMLAVVATNGPS